MDWGGLVFQVFVVLIFAACISMAIGFTDPNGTFFQVGFWTFLFLWLFGLPGAALVAMGEPGTGSGLSRKRSRGSDGQARDKNGRYKKTERPQEWEYVGKVYKKKRKD